MRQQALDNDVDYVYREINRVLMSETVIFQPIVLVIDNNLMNLGLMTEYLTAEGYHSIAVSDCSLVSDLMALYYSMLEAVIVGETIQESYADVLEKFNPYLDIPLFSLGSWGTQANLHKQKRRINSYFLEKPISRFNLIARIRSVTDGVF